ncbi:MAG: hypothetical protein JSW58_05120 [Candidatus Latescibacterota bacterium]|nr:MAG: hypothetical protein JSW58_05120 [Candidatus Latescibacterota bacterium]
MKRAALFRVSLLVMLLIIVTSGISAQEKDDLVQSALEDTTFNWASSESRGVRIYCQRGSFAEKHRSMLLRSVTTAVDEVLEYLGESRYDKPLNVLYLESREEMERIVGQPVSGFANWGASGVFVVFNPEWRSFEKHEITHVFTMGGWGAPDTTSRWMVEGIAIHSDGWCREYTVDEIAYHLLSQGQLPSLQEFFDDSTALGEIRGGFYGASVIGFIRHTHGAEALHDLWLNGIGDFKEMFGSDVKEIENLWKNYLKLKVKKEIKVDLETIEDLGCG